MTTAARTLVVTGSTHGIGRATADRLRAQGDRVIGIDLDGSEISADLATVEGRQAAVAEVLAATDVLHGMVLCAGLGGGDVWTLSLNYFGVTEVADGLRPLLADSGGGGVAVVSSSAGTTQPVADEVMAALLAGDEAKALELGEALGVKRGFVLYPTAKRALSVWVRRTCIEPGWADANISLNAIGPGATLTRRVAVMVDDPVMKDRLAVSMPMPLRGYAQADDVARLLVWLVSSENTHVTGQMIHVDGGVDATLRGPDIFVTP